ncbi:coiled-coil domain-containing protein 40-like [Synchiropus splendidus]|uniref:coiled-coil domain-containing protein 40-like n=1 Tax=Synchiropus splendidus TaxID=270530 RepID=UPI00237ECC35|nr:coiled-coil domain-containing protein 40-like [Synchiropus splendidus]
MWNLSGHNSPENMAAERPLQEEDFIILNAEHPLVRRQQTALSRQLTKQLDRINMGINEMMTMEKSDSKALQEIGVEMFQVQEHLARLQVKLEGCQQDKIQAEAENQQIQEKLESIKSRDSIKHDHVAKAKVTESQLQLEMKRLTLQLLFAKQVSMELRSKVKTLKNVKHKAAAEKVQAEDQKLKQDLYVDRLTNDLEKVTQQINMYQVQTEALAEETQAARESLSEVKMETQSLAMVRKQLLQQWNNSLLVLKRRDEAFTAMQAAISEVEHQVILLDRQLEGYKKSTIQEQEESETLMMRLNWAQMDCATSNHQISQKQLQQEVLRARYSTCVRTLRETELALTRLSKELSTYQTEMNDQRRQLERQNAVRLDLEDQIMATMEQKLTHNKAAKYSKRLAERTASLKKEKVSLTWQLENELAGAGLESSVLGQRLDSLELIQTALEEEIGTLNKMVTGSEAKVASSVTLIGQKQTAISTYNRKISQIAASTGNEDLSPMQIELDAKSSEIQDLGANIRRNQQLWMDRQGTLVGLSEELQANSDTLQNLQIELTARKQKTLRLEDEVEVEQREEAELERNSETLKELEKLNVLVNKSGHLTEALEQENMLMENNIIHRLKEEEQESFELLMKQEKTQEDKEQLINSLLEAERQIMLWERKAQLAKEIYSTVDSGVGQGEIQVMKAEIHRMEVRVNQLKKQQEKLLRESEATVARRESIQLRSEILNQNSHKQMSSGQLSLTINGLKRKIQETLKDVAEGEQEIREVQESRAGLSERLVQQRQQITELCSVRYGLDSDFISLRDIKDKNLAHLVSLQSWTKKLLTVRQGVYQTSCSPEKVGGALQSLMQRVQATGRVLHHVCETWPQYQEALRRPSLTLAASSESLKSLEGNVSPREIQSSRELHILT